MRYCQCHLERKLTNATASQVSYIPQKFAQVGEVLKLKEADGTWTNGWVVRSAGEPVDEKLLPDVHAAVKKHRQHTGDALPK